MRFKNVNLGRSEILGIKAASPVPTVGVADFDRWRRGLGYLSMFAGVAAIFTSQTSEAAAKETERAIPPRIAKQASELVSQLKKGACSKPELLRRQSEYRLPGQKNEFNMLEILAGGDNCPGTTIPNGTYTTASPFSDSGSTTGANNTVSGAQISPGVGCIEGYGAYYSSALAPDHIYTFTLSARGANPQITVDGAGNYDVSTYILSNNGTACPAGTGTVATNCLVGSDVNFDGSPEIIDATKMNSLPLNVPLYLFVDSFYAGSTPGTVNNGAYTVSIQDVTVGGVTPPSNDAPVDINGDGKTDFVTVRNTGGGTNGQITWYKSFQDGQPTTTTDWGIASDQFIPADFDGDGRDDYAVFRPGTVGRFYIVQSTTSTMRIEDFGTTGDDATVVGDYNGDGEDDIAVFRVGPNPGDPATWYYRPRSQPVFTQVAWGQNGDTPAPGDYDGDGKYDFVVQRADSNGVNGRFWVRTATGAQSSQFFGLKDDSVVPGDYDDDGKTDFAVARNDGGSIRWTFEPSGTAGVTEVTDVWGDATTDYIVQGDYDGDGRTDYAVWRPGNPGTFYIMTVSRSISSRIWGVTGDFPVANYNQH